MTIEKNFPFEMCESCPECVLDVNERVLFSYDEECRRVVTVGCKHSQKCLALKQNLMRKEVGNGAGDA